MSVSAYYDENGKRWRYQTRLRRTDGTMVRISGSSPASSNTKAAATGAERLHIARVLNATSSDGLDEDGPIAAATAQVPTLAKYVPIYLENADHSSSYLSALKSRFKMIGAMFGHLRIDQIGVDQFDVLKAALLERGFKKGSVNVYICALAGLLAFAKRKRVIKSYDSPQLIPAKLLETEKRTNYTDEEIAELLGSTSDPTLRCAYLLASEAGLRIGEIRALRREDIRSGVIQVEHSFWRNVQGFPKSGRSRKVPMTPRLREAIESVLRSHASPWVITRADGGHWHPSTAQQFTPQGGWHALRHTFCSRLANTPGVTPTQAMMLMGHADLKTTLLYVHTSEAQLEGAIARFAQSQPKLGTGQG